MAYLLILLFSLNPSIRASHGIDMPPPDIPDMADIPPPPDEAPPIRAAMAILITMFVGNYTDAPAEGRGAGLLLLLLVACFIFLAVVRRCLH